MSGQDDAQVEWELLAGAARGDDESFRHLVERYQGRLMNCFIRCGVQQGAEDLVQETFLRLYRYRRTARPLARFTTYIHTLAHHVWVDYVRKRGRVERMMEAVAREAEIYPDGATQHAAGRLDAERLLGVLTEELRTTVVLVIYQGLSYGEAATVLRIPEGTVKSRMFNGLRDLRRYLESDEHSDA